MSHPYCSHVNYALSCAEFDGLITLARGCCMICKEFATPLCVDHDHGLGRWAVRGLVCRSCNQQLRRVDSGERSPSAAIARYLADPWHLHQPSTTAKKARVRPSAKCARCDRDVAVKTDGSLWHHWLGAGSERRLCAGTRSPAVFAAATQSQIGTTARHLQTCKCPICQPPKESKR